MTQGERVKKIRKTLGLTLEKFGERIGIKKAAVSKIEKGENALTEANIKLICREFNVNEDWLRTGFGSFENMFVSDDVRFLNTIGKFGNEQNDFKKFFISTLMDLPDKYWDYIYDEFKRFEKIKEEATKTDTHPDTPEELERQYPPEDMTEEGAG